MSTIIRFSEPVDLLNSTPPHVDMKALAVPFVHETAEVFPEAHVWRSPLGNYCFYWNWMDEVGRCFSTIVAYRQMEIYL